MVNMGCPGIRRNGKPCGGLLYHLFHHIASTSVIHKIEEPLKREHVPYNDQEQVKKLKPEEEKNSKKTDNQDMVHLIKTSYHQLQQKGGIIYSRENSNVVYLNPSIYEESKTEGLTANSNTTVCPLCGSVLKKGRSLKLRKYTSKKVA